MKPQIIDIPGIGPTAAAALDEHGFKSLADLARSSVEKVNAVPGFSEARAVKVIADATELLGTPAKIPADSGKSPEKTDNTRGKDKKNKKK
ncbi:MAG: helix-hairpin-helix domain-containing protein, partial [Gammaproteobacteria bacterium]|nr:helix-hairpin-helix domain-containing protein [Gammaproteobacteria bacterium]